MVRNDDPINHELIVGSPDVHARHRNGTGEDHPRPGELSVVPTSAGRGRGRRAPIASGTVSSSLPRHHRRPALAPPVPAWDVRKRSSKSRAGARHAPRRCSGHHARCAAALVRSSPANPSTASAISVARSRTGRRSCSSRSSGRIRGGDAGRRSTAADRHPRRVIARSRPSPPSSTWRTSWTQSISSGRRRDPAYRSPWSARCWRSPAASSPSPPGVVEAG